MFSKISVISILEFYSVKQISIFDLLLDLSFGFVLLYFCIYLIAPGLRCGSWAFRSLWWHAGSFQL